MQVNDEKLIRLHDGELPPAEAEALRLGLSAAEKEKLAALSSYDGLVGNALLAEAGEVDLWQGIESRLPARSHSQLFTPARRRFMARTTAVVSALAMAAAFVFWLVPGPAQTNHCDVESLEVAAGSATVLKVPGERGDATTVLWISHDESDEWESL